MPRLASPASYPPYRRKQKGQVDDLAFPIREKSLPELLASLNADLGPAD